MPDRERSIILPPGEKLNSMTKDEVEALMRDLGSMGLGPILREKNIPPELLTLQEGAEQFLATPNYREYLEILDGLQGQVQMKPAVFERSWWDIARSTEGIIVKADEPFYEIDMRQYLEDYAAAQGAEQEREVMRKHSIALVKSHEYLDTAKLIEAIKDGTFAERPGVGKILVQAAAEVSNHLIAEANKQAEANQ